MSRVRVLIVDDSVVVRRMLTDILGSEPWIEVVGTAANGNIGLQKLTQVNPDLVTLDVEMPERDGLSTLTEIRKTHPKLPVIMFSTLTERAATTTLEALSRGATDYATKPQGTTGIVAASADVKAQLLPKIRALFPKAGASTTSLLPQGLSKPPAATPRAAEPRRERQKPAVLAIGCSTGGPNALATIFGALPTLPVPIVLTQHMPPLFTRMLADRLSAHSAIRVIEAAGGETLEAGCAYIAPGDHHMVLARKGAAIVTALNQGPPENSCRPAVDPMFRSVVAAYDGAVLGVVLTGMGQDGLHGCHAIREAGGQIIVQDEATSVVWGMPGFVARAGIADGVLPLEAIAAEIVRRVGTGAAQRALAGAVSHQRLGAP
ncbi:MAG: chemotaxis response regulator protein-glutamate methylesterase [Myxococcales bacterium]|nr:chemotaxis response regulator protein-glutamate methylesterase [Myxococcales bacterium]